VVDSAVEQDAFPAVARLVPAGADKRNCAGHLLEERVGKLLIIRHGHTCLNLPGRDERLRGWLDLPLDQEGLAEAAETAELIERNYEVDAIYSSDLRRARQTAEVLRRKTAAPLACTGDLRPWNLGVFCGQRVREIIPFLTLLNQHPELAAPSGESFYQFYGRYAHRLRSLLSEAEASPNSIAVVTHVRNLLASANIILGGDRDKVPVKGGPHTGAVVVAEKVRGAWSMYTGSSATLMAPPHPQDLAGVISVSSAA
jgi:broad specificity phosphatase PhoE